MFNVDLNVGHKIENNGEHRTIDELAQRHK